MTSLRNVWMYSPDGEWIRVPDEWDERAGTNTVRNATTGAPVAREATVRRLHIYDGQKWWTSCNASNPFFNDSRTISRLNTRVKTPVDYDASTNWGELWQAHLPKWVAVANVRSNPAQPPSMALQTYGLQGSRPADAMKGWETSFSNITTYQAPAWNQPPVASTESGGPAVSGTDLGIPAVPASAYFGQTAYSTSSNLFGVYAANGRTSLQLYRGLFDFTRLAEKDFTTFWSPPLEFRRAIFRMHFWAEIFWSRTSPSNPPPLDHAADMKIRFFRFKPDPGEYFDVSTDAGGGYAKRKFDMDTDQRHTYEETMYERGIPDAPTYDPDYDLFGAMTGTFSEPYHTIITADDMTEGLLGLGVDITGFREPTWSKYQGSDDYMQDWYIAQPAIDMRMNVWLWVDAVQVHYALPGEDVPLGMWM